MPLPPWLRFQANVYNIALSEIDASKADAPNEQLAYYIFWRLVLMEDRQTGLLGGQFDVAFEVIVIDGDVPPSLQAVVQPGEADMRFAGKTIKISGGLASAPKCTRARDFPDSDKVGQMGWPCCKGGAVPVHYVKNTEPARKKSCMVSYSPILAPELPVKGNSLILTRRERYQEVVMACLGSERKQPVINLSNLAACIMDTYPDGIMGKRSSLYQLRGVAVVVGSAPGGLEGTGYGAALAGGHVVFDCMPASLPAAGFQLCHAALFSSAEYDLSSRPSKLKRRRISPQSG